MRRRLVFAAVWLLGVAGLWLLLPPTPRHEWQLPPGDPVVRVTPDGLAVLTGPHSGMLGSGPTLYHGPVEAWDMATGHRLWTDRGPADLLSIDLKAGGRTVEYTHWTPLFEQVERVVATGERVPADSEHRLPDGRRVHARGGRTALVYAGPARYELVDAATGRRVATIAGTADRFVLSADGRRLAVAVTKPDELHLYDLETAELLVRRPLRPDGILLAVLAGGESVQIGDTVEATRTGKPLLTLPDEFPGHALHLPADDRWLILVREEAERTWLSWYDAATGREDVGRRLELHRGAGRVEVSNPDDTSGSGHHIDRGGRWLWCQTREVADPPRLTRRLLPRLPGLGHLDDDRDRDRYRLVDGGTAAVAAELAGRDYAYLQVTTTGRLVTRTSDRVQVWSLPLRPGRGLVTGLAVSWAAVVGLVARRWRRAG